MTEQQETALVQEAENLGAVDPDIIRLPDFADLVKDVNADDPASVAQAVRQMREKKPSLFATPTDWGGIHGSAFASAEERFRAGLRRPSRVEGPRSDFKDLDYALLTGEEAHALERYLSGTRSSWDRSILRRALAKQQRDESPNGGAA